MNPPFSGGEVSIILGNLPWTVVSLVADSWGVGAGDSTAGCSACRLMDLCHSSSKLFLFDIGCDRLVVKKTLSCVRSNE